MSRTRALLPAKPAASRPTGAAAAGAIAVQAGAGGFESYAGVRMLLYSHDTFGLGHLRRCLKISDALVRNFPGLSVLLLTGSPVVHRYRLPPGVDYIKLPAVRKTGREGYEARSLGTAFDRILDLRVGLIREAIRGFSPHVVLVDHSPAGMKGEMLPALDGLREKLPGTTILLGLRDILDAPDLVIEQWTREGIYDLLRNRYDHILIYGSPKIFDPITAYAFPPDLRQKTHFCNYLTEGAKPRVHSARRRKTGRPLVVVTIGGGDGASDTVIFPYLEMLESRRAPTDFDTVILPGPFMPEDLRASLRERCARLPVTIRPHVTDTGPLLQQSDLVVATAGYNTTTEILFLARRAILIPRMLHRQEQVLRAGALADLGLVTMIHPGLVTPKRLNDEVERSLRSDLEPLTLARRNGLIPFDGCDRIVDYCRPILQAHRLNTEKAS